MTQLQPFDGHRFVFVFFKNVKSFEEAGLSRRVRYKGPDISLWLEPWPQASAEAQRKKDIILTKEKKQWIKRIKYPPLSQKGGLCLEKKTKASHSNLIPTII